MGRPYVQPVTSAFVLHQILEHLSMPIASSCNMPSACLSTAVSLWHDPVLRLDAIAMGLDITGQLHVYGPLAWSHAL